MKFSGRLHHLEARHLPDPAVEGGGLPKFQFPRLLASPGLRHAVFTRLGGVSRGRFATLNVAADLGDDPAAVSTNRRRICEDLAFCVPVLLRQHHGTRVVCIEREAEGDGVPAKIPPRADAVVTDRPGLLLIVQVADCQAVVVHDPIKQVVANIHSGWRGSVGNILQQAVSAMQAAFGCRPENLVAGIGPSLGPCCAEFIHYRKEIPPPLWQYRVAENHFDFWAMSVDQLKAAGLAEENIEVSGLCTRCRTDLFYSYRGEKITGRFAAAAGLVAEGRRR